VNDCADVDKKVSGWCPCDELTDTSALEVTSLWFFKNQFIIIIINIITLPDGDERILLIRYDLTELIAKCRHLLARFPDKSTVRMFPTT